MGKGGDQTSTTTNTPWSGVEPSLENLISSADSWYAGTNSNSTTAGLNSDITDAWSMISDRAKSGSSLTDAAQKMVEDTLSGSMFEQDFNSMWDYSADELAKTYSEEAIPAVTSAFSSYGRSGSGAEQDAVSNATEDYTSALADLASQIYGTERGYQMDAAGMANDLANQDYTDLYNMLTVGEDKRSYEQELADEDYKNLSNYSSLLSTASGGTGTSTTTEPTESNYSGLGALLGLALGGATGATGSSLLTYLLGGSAAGGMFGT